MFAWRSSTELMIYDTLAILAILAILTLPALQIRTAAAGVLHYGIGFFWSGIAAAFGPFVLLFDDIKWKAIPQTGWKKHLFAVLRGVAIAAPLLLIFGALFVAADAVYEGLVERTLNIRADLIIQHTFFIGLFSWLCAGYLRGTMVGDFSGGIIEPEPSPVLENEIKPQVPSVTMKTEEIPVDVLKAAVEAAKPKFDWNRV